jgi:Leucine-rich repeat (LRR) protein
MERLAFIVSLTLFVVLNSCIFGTHANESSPIYYQHSNGKISTKKEESNYDNSNNNNNNSNNKIVTVHDIEILRASERLALIEIYTETQGEKWRDNAKWLNGDPCVNNWYGVTCNAMNLVTAIQLAANQVNGTIPDIFQQFTQLTVLDLSLNYLKGAAPPSITSLVLLEEVDLGYNYLLMSMSLFSGMKQLEKLCLRWNTLITGSLHAIKNLKKLHTLSLRDNHMESLTLEGIEQLTSLKYVDLTKSGLRGELKPKYLHNLVTFHASNNRLSGSLFSQMGTEERNDEYSLDALKELDVAFNTLSGPIPRMIQAKNLEKLDLSNNRFYQCNFVLSDHEKLTSLKMNSNRLEQPFFYNFYMMKNIEEFECSHCHLNGVISMPKDHVFKYLKIFNVYNNQLTGQLPSALWNMKALEVLDVSNNQLSGEISSKIGQLTALSTVRLHFNQFSGSIPIEFSMLVGLETLRLVSSLINFTCLLSHTTEVTQLTHKRILPSFSLYLFQRSTINLLVR